MPASNRPWTPSRKHPHRQEFRKDTLTMESSGSVAERTHVEKKPRGWRGWARIAAAEMFKGAAAALGAGLVSLAWWWFQHRS